MKFNKHLDEQHENDPDSNISRHFNLPNHSTDDMSILGLLFYMHLQKAQKEKHWKNGSFLHLDLCILQDSTSTLRIFNNILSYVTSIRLSTIPILRICPSFCLISVGSINFSLLDNGLCSKRRYFQFASKCLYFMLFTCCLCIVALHEARRFF